MNFFEGVYGIGNTPLDQPFKKVQRGINHMQKIVDEIKIGDDCEKEIMAKLLMLVTDKFQYQLLQYRKIKKWKWLSFTIPS